MRWVVGLDLRGRCEGALHFAAWLRESAPDTRLVAVHVSEEPDQVALAQRATRELLARTDLTGCVDAVRTIEAESIDIGLVEVCADEAADGLFVGRRARRDEDVLLPLGRVTRRLLRVLPGPVIVSPPDLGPGTVGDGPLVLATDLGPHSDGTVALARTVAAATGRPLALVHVAPSPQSWPLQIPRATAKALSRDLHDRATVQLRTWARRHTLADEDAVVVQGPIADAIASFARERDAAMILVGSRRLGALARLLAPSVGESLASSSGCPVALVPPVEP